MKYYITLLSLIIIVASTFGQQRHLLRDRVNFSPFPLGIGTFCVSETGASDEDVTELMSHKLPSRNEGKCLAACIFQRLGVSEESLKTRLQDAAFSILNFLRERNSPLYDTSMNIVLKCGAKMYFGDSKDICKEAFEMMNCGLQESLSNGVVENVFSSILETNRRILFPENGNLMTRNHQTFVADLKRLDVLKLLQ